MPYSILLVDDEPRITAALMLRLQAAGYIVNHAINGLAGLEAAKLHRPDVMIVDIRMPDIDGFELCRRVKQDGELASIRIGFLTANAKESARKKAFQVGGRFFLAKPYEPTEVLAAIERALAA